MNTYPLPHLAEGDLSRFLDGQASAEIIKHVETCPDCTATLDTLRSVDAVLGLLSDLDRCPSAEMLVDYGDGALEADSAEWMRLHLEFCSHCSAELAQYRHFAVVVADLNQPLPGQPNGKTAGPEMAEPKGAKPSPFVDFFSRPDLTAMPVAVRGNLGAVELIIGDFRVNLATDRDSRPPQRYRLSGGLTGPVSGPVTVHLWLGETLVATTVAEDLTSLPADQSAVERTVRFTFSELAPGDYLLTFALDSQELRLPETVKVGD